jgi:Delta3-Delta2-enoyl-CoA isomerase
MPALDMVERHWRAGRRGKDILNEKDMSVGAGALVIVGNRAQDKFFSNGTCKKESGCVREMRSERRIGLHYASISQDLNFVPHTFNPVVRRLLFFPSP